MDRELLTEAHVRALVPENIFQRGDRYCERGAVLEVALRGDVLHAFVQGREDRPYAVELTTRGDRMLARCTCRYADEGGPWCKHIVAAMLVLCRYEDIPTEVQPPLHALLAPLDRQGLQELIEAVVEQMPGLYEAVRVLVEQPHARGSRRSWSGGGRDVGMKPLGARQK